MTAEQLEKKLDEIADRMITKFATPRLKRASLMHIAHLRVEQTVRSLLASEGDEAKTYEALADMRDAIGALDALEQQP